MVKRTKNQIRREKAKLRKKNEDINHSKSTVEQPNVLKEELTDQKEPPTSENLAPEQEGEAEPKPKQEDIPDETQVGNETLPEDELSKQYFDVFNRFNQPVKSNKSPSNDLVVIDSEGSDSEDESDQEEEEKIQTSKKQERLKSKIPLSLLKASTNQPRLVDWYDADAKDPYLLVALKSQLNVVQVPEHWQAKRDYLSMKKGLEKRLFQLPQYIRDTGIEEMRNVVSADDKTLKQSQRERVQVKLGRLDIDYHKLHNAFFVHQTKPRLYKFGEVFFEGKDTDDKSEETLNIRPGTLSPALRAALEMPPGDTNVAPPWIYLMQQLGKPPSYRSLVIPGLDADYTNSGYREKSQKRTRNFEVHRWGQLREYVESSDEEEEEEDEEEDEDEVRYEEADYAKDEEKNDTDSVLISEFNRGSAMNSSNSEAPTTSTIPSNLEGKSLYTIVDTSKRPIEHKHDDSIRENKEVQDDEPDFKF